MRLNQREGLWNGLLIGTHMRYKSFDDEYAKQH